MKAASVFTYTLGKSLYIPLTSRCNSLTLPQTRGVNFVLPNSVISSLLNVRLAEDHQSDNVSISDYDSQITLEDRSILPPNNLSWKVEEPWTNQSVATSKTIPEFPSTHALFQEVKHHLELHVHDIDSIVFAGEGEPTLRLEALETLASQIYCFMKTYNTNEMNMMKKPMRIVTNGLVLCTHPEKERKNVLHRLLSSGVQTLSIALMTSSPHQYETLMQPIGFSCCSDDDSQIHSKLCELVQDAVRIGFNVELTGVDHEYVDKQLANNLAQELGASSFRFRPYFP
jgi:hypothetical protein